MGYPVRYLLDLVDIYLLNLTVTVGMFIVMIVRAWKTISAYVGADRMGKDKGDGKHHPEGGEKPLLEDRRWRGALQHALRHLRHRCLEKCGGTRCKLMVQWNNIVYIGGH